MLHWKIFTCGGRGDVEKGCIRFAAFEHKALKTRCIAVSDACLFVPTSPRLPAFSIRDAIANAELFNLRLLRA
jgi:hypothetical protein